MKDSIVIKFCSCNNTDLLSSNFIVEITHLIVKFIEQKNKRTRNVDICIFYEFIFSNEMLQKIDIYVNYSKIHTYLLLEHYNNDYLNSLKELCIKEIFNCHFFGNFPCYYDKNNLFKFFQKLKL